VRQRLGLSIAVGTLMVGLFGVGMVATAGATVTSATPSAQAQQSGAQGVCVAVTSHCGPERPLGNLPAPPFRPLFALGSLVLGATALTLAFPKVSRFLRLARGVRPPILHPPRPFVSI
jgi:hypothetical protein